MLGTNRLPIGGMKWQHAVILMSMCEMNSIINFLSAYRTGLLTPLLTWFRFLFFLPFLLGQTILSPCSPSHFFFRANCSKTNFSSIFAFPGLKTLRPTPIQFNAPSSVSFLALENFRFLPIHSILLPLESKQCPQTPASVLACADSLEDLCF